MRRTGLIALAAVQILLVAVLGTPVSAQTTTGGITGVVRDTGGGVMPGVTVKATHEATNAETTAVSNEVGVYVLRGLAVGRYAVLAELAGFQASKNTDVVVRVNEDVRLDISLKVGAVSEWSRSAARRRPSIRAPARSRPWSIRSESRTCR